MKVMEILNLIITRYSHQNVCTGTGGLENMRTSEYHSNYNILKIDQNTEKSPGYLKLPIRICTN